LQRHTSLLRILQKSVRQQIDLRYLFEHFEIMAYVFRVVSVA
jgi:hypothetical protein